MGKVTDILLQATREVARKAATSDLDDSPAFYPEKAKEGALDYLAFLNHACLSGEQLRELETEYLVEYGAVFQEFEAGRVYDQYRLYEHDDQVARFPLSLDETAALLRLEREVRAIELVLAVPGQGARLTALLDALHALDKVRES